MLLVTKMTRLPSRSIATAVARISSWTHEPSLLPFPISTVPWSHTGTKMPGLSRILLEAAGQPGAFCRYSRPPFTVGSRLSLAAPTRRAGAGGGGSGRLGSGTRVGCCLQQEGGFVIATTADEGRQQQAAKQGG